MNESLRKTKIWALCALGEDRPGIVAGVSEALFRLGGNLEDSRMGRVEGDFGILLWVAFPAELSRREIEQALKPVQEKFDLTLALREVCAEEIQAKEKSDVQVYRLVLYGADQPGLVYRVTDQAARLGINILDLRTLRTEKENGEALYTLVLEMDVPYARAAESFREALGGIQEKLHVDVTFEPQEADDL